MRNCSNRVVGPRDSRPHSITGVTQVISEIEHAPPAAERLMPDCRTLTRPAIELRVLHTALVAQME